MYLRLLLLTALVLAIGCSDRVIVNPDNRTMLGTWVPDEKNSTVPPEVSLKRVTLILREDGTFEAQGFPKEISFGRQARVSGHWTLKHEDGGWSLALPWETAAMSILDGARLINKGNDLLIQFGIGDPDENTRLLLRKQPTQ